MMKVRMGSTEPTPARFDLIVVGSGIAGLYAALLAAPHMNVLLLTKGALEESNTRYAQGGIAAAITMEDSPELHRRDTIGAGDGLCNPEAVAILTQEASDCIADLLAHGVPFDRERGEIALTLEAAHSLPRVLHAGGDATGASIERALVAQVREAGVIVRENTLVTSLLVQNGHVEGIRLLLPHGGREEVRSPRVILASGGAGQLFARTTNPAVATGDGLAIAYEAGAELMDLEFMQFHPTALVSPGAPSFLISEAVRGEGGILRDTTGYAFMADYHSDRELAPRDVVARAIHSQMVHTGSSHVWLDITHLPPERIERRFPSIVAFCRRYDIDPVQHPIPVAPAAHYMMGGIRTDTWARTSIPGLLACGEVACTGVHGANRLASNSLLEGLVFARRAVQGLMGDDLPGGAPAPRATPLPWKEPVLGSHRGHRPAQTARISLADIMWQHAGLVRSHSSLTTARTAIAALDIGAAETSDRATAETANLALLGSLLVEAAILRDESRGAHFRSDRPQRDPSWEGHILISREGACFSPLLSTEAFRATGAIHA